MRKCQKSKTKALAISAIVIFAAILAVVAVLLASVKTRNNKEEISTIVPEIESSIPEITIPEEAIQEETIDGTIESTNGQTIFLTFDDGPSDNTDRVLEILDQYGVKATFFVLENEGRADQLKKVASKGHEIAVHSSCHDYDTLYADLDSFKADVYSCMNFIENTIGKRPFLYRFPGGTNNQVHYVSISACIDFLKSEDLTHFDWNISSGDAAGVTVDTETIVDNVLSRIHENGSDTLVVLMHDSSSKTTTVEALERVLPILIDEGYGFSKIKRDTTQINFEAYD